MGNFINYHFLFFEHQLCAACVSLNDRHMLRDATFLAVLDENVCLMYASELKCECYLVFLPFFCTGSRFTFPAMVCYLHFDKIFTCALTGLLNSAG